MDHEVINNDGEKKMLELHMFKILIVGESGVGKTSFVRRYVNGKFTTSYKATIAVDFANKSVDWNDHCRVDMFLWDLAGQERLGTQIQSYFRDTHGVIFVYDLERSEEQNRIKDWKRLLDEKCTLRDEPYAAPSILLVNKSDTLGGISNVNMKPFNDLAKSYDLIGAYPISAKTGEGVDIAMKVLLKQLIKHQRVALSNGLPAMQQMDKVKLASYKQDTSSSSCC
jgi:small GTP-binding protein